MEPIFVQSISIRDKVRNAMRGKEKIGVEEISLITGIRCDAITKQIRRFSKAHEVKFVCFEPTF